MLHDALDRLARCHVAQADETDPVVLADLVVVRWVLEREGQEALLLQIRLVDPRKAAHDDGGAAQQPRREGRMLTARAFTIVRVADDDPLDALRLVVARDGRERLRL